MFSILFFQFNAIAHKFQACFQFRSSFNIRTKILSTSQEINLFGERMGCRVRDFRSVIFCATTRLRAADYMHAYTSNFIFIQMVNFR